MPFVGWQGQYRVNLTNREARAVVVEFGVPAVVTFEESSLDAMQEKAWFGVPEEERLLIAIQAIANLSLKIREKDAAIANLNRRLADAEGAAEKETK